MLDQIITIFSSGDFLSSVSNNLDIMASTFNRYLSGANNLRMVSIILMLLAFILFLFLIIILYVKSIISFLKSDGGAAAKNVAQKDDHHDEELVNELEQEKELEKELQRELEQAHNEKLTNERQETQKKIAEEEQQKKEKEEETIIRNREKAEKKAKEKAVLEENRAKIGVDLDWKKGKLNELEATAVKIDANSLQYQQSFKQLPELLGLIIDMVGRGVDELKIAQTIMFRNQGQNSEDDILQTIEAVQDFIALCINGKFDNLQSASPLPREDAALFHLAKGDPSLALALIEALMDNEIDKSSAMQLGAKRDMIFNETSNYACTFGTLAALSDVHLATGSFELAIELAPQNVNAWSRVADMYAQAESNNKAVWAYQNVLDLADEEIYPRQVANANRMLSQYYYAQGNSLQAAKMYNSSKQYYDSIGINRRLDKKEIEIIEIIESRQNEDLEATVIKILQNRENRQYSYA